MIRLATSCRTAVRTGCSWGLGHCISAVDIATAVLYLLKHSQGLPGEFEWLLVWLSCALLSGFGLEPIRRFSTDLTAGRIPENTLSSPQSYNRSVARLAPVITAVIALILSCVRVGGSSIMY